jgi:PIN domain nuclease of toxin-antitoxin system
MDKRKDPIVFVDTHIVVWLFEANLERLSKNAQDCLEHSQILVSPMVQLELEFLREIKRIRHKSDYILDALLDSIGLEVSYTNFHQIVNHAKALTWTRDPFDRLITAEAMALNAPLVTLDQLIRKHYSEVIY